MADIQKYIRVGDYITNIIEPNTGENASYFKVSSIPSGIPTDRGIYVKLKDTGEFFKKNWRLL